MFAFANTKWILFEDPIKAMELQFKNLEIKDLASYYEKKYG